MPHGLFSSQPPFLRLYTENIELILNIPSTSHPLPSPYHSNPMSQVHPFKFLQKKKKLGAPICLHLHHPQIEVIEPIDFLNINIAKRHLLKTF